MPGEIAGVKKGQGATKSVQRAASWMLCLEKVRWKKYPVGLFGQIILPGLMGLLITHSRETYQPTSIMRWDRGICHGSCHCWSLGRAGFARGAPSFRLRFRSFSTL